MDIMAICFVGAVDSFMVMKSIDLYNLLSATYNNGDLPSLRLSR
jgi:hypothetical protein